MWQLTCSFQDELKSVKLLADDAWQVAIGYSSDSSDLKKNTASIYIFIICQPPTPYLEKKP